ncbi:MAG: hypothetical protein C0393_04530, partial [Anaerolinea sp.]|nr:hypothetical protein [Anaerolinea sp.]
MTQVLIIGAGLAGLSAGIQLAERGVDVTILERAPRAGGLTSSWRDYRAADGDEDTVLQYPMHMFFHSFHNLFDLMQRAGCYDNLTDWLQYFLLTDSKGRRYRLEMDDWASRHLPPPLHGLGMLCKLRLSLWDMWSFVRFAIAAIYVGSNFNRGLPRTGLIEDETDLRGAMRRLRLTQRVIDFVETFVPSIYNLYDFRVSARRMMTVLYGILFKERDDLHYKLLKDNYTTGMIDQLVAYFQAQGGQLWLNTEVQDIACDGERVTGLQVKRSAGPPLTCTGCGNRYYATDRVVCASCGLETQVSGLRISESAKSYGLETDAPTWNPSAGLRREHSGERSGQALKPETADFYISAIQSHQLRHLIAPDNPMRRMPLFKTLWAYKGAQLTIARLWFDRPLTAERVIYGTSRRRYIFNGAMDIGNIMPRYTGGGSVVDVLIDEGEIIASYSEEELRQAILKDLTAILPATRQAKVLRFLAAHIHPQVLYHREYPRLEHERLSGCRTPLENFFLAGCWLGKIGIGMESAVY